MRFYSKIKRLLFTLSITYFNLLSAQNVSFEETSSFFQNIEVLSQDDILWGYLNVPENWNSPEGDKIKVAVSVLRGSSDNSNNNAVVFIQGGPGAAGIQNMGFWINHPLRKNNDIVLFDVRGTGFSEPRLCPDLGKEFLKILAKNQTVLEDEKQKSLAALDCKLSILERDIDIRAYHSLSIAKDLYALRETLGYDAWNVYGVSYGTHIAQVYASEYPDDIKALILDSSISDITEYYTKNTSNYINSLSRVFKNCLTDEGCNSEYPDLENTYYNVIESLQKSPITIKLEKDVIGTEEFTYNAEDFKVAIQQALYNKELIEIIPLLIYQFQERNKEALGNLVAAFSSLLNMDYGVYYCVSCNEVLTLNNKSDYDKDVRKYKRLMGGVSFYESDFKVCEKWSLNRTDSLKTLNYSELSSLTFPVLVVSGEYDPITPAVNGEETAKYYEKSYFVDVPSFGHIPSFSNDGSVMVKTFINSPFQKPVLKFKNTTNKLDFVKDITIKPGVSKLGNSLSSPDPIFLSPLLIAILLMLVFIFTYLVKLLRNKYRCNQDRIIRVLNILTSIVGIVSFIILIESLINVAKQNYFILAFGLPGDFDYVFTLLIIFESFLILTLLYFIFYIRKIQDRSIVFSVIFSNILLVTYLFYWGFL